MEVELFFRVILQLWPEGLRKLAHKLLLLHDWSASFI